MEKVPRITFYFKKIRVGTVLIYKKDRRNDVTVLVRDRYLGQKQLTYPFMETRTHRTFDVIIIL